VETPPLLPRPTPDSIAVLTAIKEEEEEEDNQEELKQELVEQILKALEEKKELQTERGVLENKIAQYLTKKKVSTDNSSLKYLVIVLIIPAVRERPVRVAKTST